MVPEAKFQIGFANADHAWRDLVHGVNFRLDEDRIPEVWRGYLPPLVRDLARVGTAVYVADRLAQRPRRSRGTGRTLQLRAEVTSPEFWACRAELIARILRVISNDVWTLQFTPGEMEPAQAGLFGEVDVPPVVCLYSGGLDSAAGLLNRLRDGARFIVTVTVCHQPGQRRRVLRQLETFRRAYGARIVPVMVRTTLRRAPLLKHQELSQRCRSFLFLSIGGAVAATVGASEIEIFESGVGVLNVPPMTGMLVGARATRSCHPQLLALMADLVSAVAGRPISFSLPFVRRTKAEVVRVLADTNLHAVVPLTASCVHYPVRIRGAAKQCGLCFACIDRRQSLFASGVDDPVSQYHRDIRSAECETTPGDLENLRADLFLVARLRELCSFDLPAWFSRHLYGSQLAAPGDPVDHWRDLMVRYRAEWLRWIDHAREQRLKWAELIDAPKAA